MPSSSRRLQLVLASQFTGCFYLERAGVLRSQTAA